MYVDQLRKTRVRNDTKPLVQRGKLIRGQWPAYCIVSFYRIREAGVVKLDVYHKEEKKNYLLVLSPADMEVGAALIDR